LGNKTVISC